MRSILAVPLVLALCLLGVAAQSCDLQCCQSCSHHYSVCCEDSQGNYYCTPDGPSQQHSECEGNGSAGLWLAQPLSVLWSLASGCNANDVALRFPSTPAPTPAPPAWSSLTAATLAALAPAEFANATAADIASIPAAACSGFSAPQVQLLAPSACAGFTAAQFEQIQPFTMMGFDAAQLAALSGSVCQVLSPEQLELVPAASCVGFTPVCLAEVPGPSQQGDCFPVPGPQWTVSPYTQAVMMGVVFTDAKTGFIAGGDNGIGASVIKTTDGGISWQVLPIHQPALMFTSLAGFDETSVVANGIGLVGFGGTQYSVDGASFTNSSEVDSLGHSVNYQQSQDCQIIEGTENSYGIPANLGFWNETAHSNVMMLTNDGGAHFEFRQLNTSTDPAIHARYASFPSPNVGFIASGKWPNYQRSLSKSDGLRHRNDVRHLSQHLTLHSDSKKNIKMHVASGRANNYKSNGGDGNVALSTIAAAIALAVSPRSRLIVVSVFVSGAQVGIIQRSTDGFNTWQQVFYNDTYYFNQISCASESVCYAVAENEDFGYILKTADGGDSWTELRVEWFTSMMACKALSEDEVWVGGGMLSAEGIFGAAFHSTDGGANFERMQLDGYYVMDFDFLEPTAGFAVGSDASGNGALLFFGSAAPSKQ